MFMTEGGKNNNNNNSHKPSVNFSTLKSIYIGSSVYFEKAR